MVLDNADDLDMFFAKSTSNATGSECTLPLAYYLPQDSRGSVLITTRDERVGKRLAGGHACIEVKPMSPQEAHELLARGRRNPNNSDLDVSSTLLQALEYLPLAITQAAAFIDENYITYKEYLDIFQKSESDVQDLLEQELGDLRRDSESQNSVIRTWKLSFDLISKQRPRAAEMLSLMAVLDRQGVLESLLRDETDRDIDVTTALGTLLSFSLIKAGRDGAGYEMHRLVQIATRKWLEMQGDLKVWQEKALSVVANMFPSGEFENWTTCESLLPHAQTVVQYGDTDGPCPEEYARLLSNMAYFDIVQGRYEMACMRNLAAIEVQKNIFGPDSASILTTMNNLAVTYEQQGRWEEAEKLHVQVLETSERVLGSEHPETLKSMDNLATTYRKQGRWEEAEKLYMQILEIRERVLGAEHPRTLTSMDNLARVHSIRFRHSEAIALMQSVIELRTKTIGANHPSTIVSVNFLKKWVEAKKAEDGNGGGRRSGGDLLDPTIK